MSPTQITVILLVLVAVAAVVAFAVVAGRLKTVVLRTDGRSPSVEAELFDGTGQVALVWMGRRRIVGLEAGTRLVARGRVAQRSDGRLVVYNPSYELRP